MDQLEHKLASLAIILFLALTSAMGQSILAGDTSAPGVVYTDLDDIMVSANYPWNEYDADTVDINNDGVDDLRFVAKDDAAGHVSLKSSRMNGLNGTEIVYYEPQPYWVDELQDSAMINAESLWSVGGKLRFQNWYPDTIEEGGVFTWGFAGFRIPASSGYLYGWVHLTANFTYVFIHDGAYQSMETGIDDHAGVKSIHLYPNPFTTTTTLSYTLSELSSVVICIFNPQGQLIENINQEQPKGEQKFQWNAKGLPAGMYYFRIQAGEMDGGGKMVKM